MDVKAILKAKLKLAKENVNEWKKKWKRNLCNVLLFPIVCRPRAWFCRAVAVAAQNSEDIYNFRNDTLKHTETKGHFVHLRIAALNLCTFRCKLYEMHFKGRRIASELGVYGGSIMWGWNSRDLRTISGKLKESLESFQSLYLPLLWSNALCLSNYLDVVCVYN